MLPDQRGRMTSRCIERQRALDDVPQIVVEWMSNQMTMVGPTFMCLVGVRGGDAELLRPDTRGKLGAFHRTESYLSHAQVFSKSGAMYSRQHAARKRGGGVWGLDTDRSWSMAILCTCSPR